MSTKKPTNKQNIGFKYLEMKWGKNYKRNLQFVAHVFRTFGLDPNDPKYGNDPKLCEFLFSMISTIFGIK